MVILPDAYYENLKRYWRRRKYQLINNGAAHHHNKKKLKVSRLGGGGAASSPRRLWKIRRTPKFHLKNIVSPIKLLAKFHDAYIDMMICWANKMANPITIGGFLRGKKRVAKSRRVSLVISSGEQVDSRLVMEIYKRVAASRQSRTEL